ncbi:MAG: glutaredoxin domain-containing protein, partial [Pseudomonadota bacterium]
MLYGTRLCPYCVAARRLLRRKGVAFQPLLNSEWVDSVVFWLAAGVKGGRSPAQRTLDAGCQSVRWC